MTGGMLDTALQLLLSFVKFMMLLQVLCRKMSLGQPF